MSLLNFAGYCYFQELEKLKQENKELYEELLELRRQIQVKISHTTNSLLQAFGQLGRDLVAKNEIPLVARPRFPAIVPTDREPGAAISQHASRHHKKKKKH